MPHWPSTLYDSTYNKVIYFVFCSGSWLNEKKKKTTNTNHTVMITFQIRDDTEYFVTWEEFTYLVDTEIPCGTLFSHFALVL